MSMYASAASSAATTNDAVVKTLIFFQLWSEFAETNEQRFDPLLWALITH